MRIKTFIAVAMSTAIFVSCTDTSYIDKELEDLKNEILAHCAQHIAKYALPRELVWRTELPKTLVGKVAYRVLEEEAAEETA